MDASRFDHVVSRLAQAENRRRALGVFGASALLASGLHGDDDDAVAGRKKRKKRKNKNKKKKKDQGGTLRLRELCTRGKDSCVAGLRCDSPTTRNSCSSTVDGVNTWCCVPPGGKCTECDCCGNNYCNGDGVCVTNPEG
ncbi:MAG: hypothetical protein KC442_17825 [Thermomicrobiales bacterium]|nr:hypothetical protein [Thermomicrobiales bacterium]